MTDGAQDPRSCPDDAQKKLALRLITEARDEAIAQGASSGDGGLLRDLRALTDMIDIYGEQTVADMVTDWPDRIRDGEFTLKQGGELSLKALDRIRRRRMRSRLCGRDVDLCVITHQSPGLTRDFLEAPNNYTAKARNSAPTLRGPAPGIHPTAVPSLAL